MTREHRVRSTEKLEKLPLNNNAKNESIGSLFIQIQTEKGRDLPQLEIESRHGESGEDTKNTEIRIWEESWLGEFRFQCSKIHVSLGKERERDRDSAFLPLILPSSSLFLLLFTFTMTVMYFLLAC